MSKEIDVETGLDDEFIPNTDTDVKRPLFTIVPLEDGRANPCVECGRYPRLHIANFRNPSKHSKPYFIDDGGCGNCDGKWYATPEEAIAEWNRRNEGGRLRDPSKRDWYDMRDELMAGFRIPE